MPLTKGKSKEDCLRSTYKKEIAAGKSKKVARAITLSHCSKYWGGISKKKDKKNEIMELILEIEMELIELGIIGEELEEEKKRIQKSD